MQTPGKSNLIKKAARAGSWSLARRVAKSVPFVGTALSIGLVGYSVKHKGLFGGVLNSALDATPVVGALKNALELFIGDLLPDKKPKVR